MRKRFLNFLVLALSTFIVLIFLEVCARTYLLHFADDTWFLRYASLRQLQKGHLSKKPIYSPHLYLGYYPTPNYRKGENRHNSLGYRGEEIDIPKLNGEFRIVCMGGSTTYTAFVDDYRMSYPYRLENHLKSKGYKNVDVINAGAGGWSSWESLINFEFRVLDLDPDMIIVYQGVNDINAMLVWPPSAYKGDNSGYKVANEAIFMPSILEYSTLFRMFLIRMDMIQPHASFERTVMIPGETDYARLFRKQKIEGVYPDGIFSVTSAKEMLKSNQPKYFERNIGNIIAIAKSKGIRVVLSSFAYSSLFTHLPRVASEEYVSAYDEINSLLKGLATEMDVHFFDFASVFPPDKRYYRDGRHLNEEGAKLKAEFFADFLSENHLLP